MINTIEKRKTEKGFFLVEHRILGKCAVLSKEVNGKYGLRGGEIKKGEPPGGALKREVPEEMSHGSRIKKMKYLDKVLTKTQIHQVFAMKVSGECRVGKGREITGVAFFPLEAKYNKERLAILENTEPHAKKALDMFMHHHDRKSYECSEIKFVLENSTYKNVFDKFKKELDELKKKIKG